MLNIEKQVELAWVEVEVVWENGRCRRQRQRQRASWVGEGRERRGVEDGNEMGGGCMKI
jgi:hypothetical protein